MYKWLAMMVFSVCLIAGTQAKADPRTHDGFYLQAGVGLGGYRMSVDDTESTFSGLTLPAQFFIGGTIAKHLVIAGGFFLDMAPAPKYKVDGTESELLGDFKQFLLGIGTVFDFYVWSDKGLHFPFFIGWGGMESVWEGDASGNDPTGLIMYFGAGYDVFVADELSIGGLFRFVIAPLKYEDYKYPTIEPGVLFTLTYN
ncbi:MAG: hypothetical protein JXX29_14825 [Deltaproteobacteria bacterium]|nr:hypothetical protein [Deltaproteobacteria bacterium]MBN2672954.1 hypothetical protein [Deltaproteobacteria bacterium]